METKREIGRRIMSEVLGESYFARREATTSEFNLPIRIFSEENCFGDLWNRPGLERKTRSLLECRRKLGTRWGTGRRHDPALVDRQLKRTPACDDNCTDPPVVPGSSDWESSVCGTATLPSTGAEHSAPLGGSSITRRKVPSGSRPSSGPAAPPIRSGRGWGRKLALRRQPAPGRPPFPEGRRQPPRRPGQKAQSLIGR